MPSTKSENPTLPAFPSGLKRYLLAARPRTWVLSLAPVCIGTWMANGPIDWWVFGLSAAFSLLIQIGANYANDYFDFQKGADTAERIGPPRATALGWITPSAMFQATLVVFGVALLLAIPLMMRVGFWSFFIAIVCVLFGLLYTGGPKPLGYLGWGEILVLVFFGPVACCGAYYLQTFSWNETIFIASLAPGLLSVSALVANNLRDETGDRKAGKQTLVVRFGRKFGSWLYGASVVGAGIVPLLLLGSILISLVLWLFAFPSIRTAFCFQHPKELIRVLQASARLQFLYTFLFCAAWA